MRSSASLLLLLGCRPSAAPEAVEIPREVSTPHAAEIPRPVADPRPVETPLLVETPPPDIDDDLPGVALRWAFGPAEDQRWPIVGLEFVSADDALIWRSDLDSEDAARLGSLHVDAAQRHVQGFREHALPGLWWVEFEPTRILLADRAGVRVHERRTGRVDFRYSPPDPDAPRMWFDGGTFSARRGKRRCEGDAGHGGFAARCTKDLLYFDGHALAVIAMGQAIHLRDSTTLAEPSSTRSGGAPKTTASLHAGGYRLRIEGMIFLQ